MGERQWATRRDLLSGAAALIALLAAPGWVWAAQPALAQLATLARDVDRAESVRAVKRLQLAWASYVDLGRWDEAAALFAADAEMAHGAERHRGRADIRAYFERAIGRGTMGLPDHMIHTPFLFAPIITLAPDGETAQGRWHAISLRGKLGEDAAWSGGIFECTYRRNNGVWKISRQIFSPTMLGPYETGWRPTAAELPLVPYHFQPDDVGRPIPLGPDVPTTMKAVPLATLAGRIQALRDETEVRNLQNAYGYYVDWKMWDDAVDLFVPTGSVSISGIGTYRDTKGIRRSLDRNGPAGLRPGEVNDHIQGDLIVEVAADGRHARARGIQLGMIGRDNAQAWWTLTRFDNAFVKQGGVWRIAAVRETMGMMTDYDKGWGKDWQAQPKPDATFAPDSPTATPLPAPWPLERPAPVAAPLAHVSVAQARDRLHAAAGVDSMENLAGGYGQYLDDFQWEELATLFAAQGERDSAGGGFIRTPARIASFSRQRYGAYNPKRTGTQMHMRTQPVIHVSTDGLKGQLRTRLFQTSVVPVDGAASGPRSGPMFVTGTYEDDIVFEAGRWKIKRADIDHLIYAPYKTGWTQIAEGSGSQTAPPMGAVAGAQFDAYNTGDLHPSFPKVPHMWFHYRNPVSGRSPPYLMPKYILPEP